MKPYFDQAGITIYLGDCREVAPNVSGVTAVVSDPPYGLEFMGKEWDKLGAAVVDDPASVGGFQDGRGGNPYSRNKIRYGKTTATMQPWFQECFEAIGSACLPGAMLLAFGGSRTYHRLVCAIEDAGFEIRDCIQWIYGSGFPKSLDISKAIDKAAGAEREVVGQHSQPAANKAGGNSYQMSVKGMPETADITTPSTEHAKTWNGYGTALKPAHEPICVAMKPLSGTYAQNAIEHGVAGINVDGCRVATDDTPRIGNTTTSDCENIAYGTGWQKSGTTPPTGRWPANIIHDGSDEVVRLFPETVGKVGMTGNTGQGNNIYGNFPHQENRNPGVTDSGSAARFFYVAKESQREIQRAEDFPLWGESHEAVKNTHPTVKPLALMEYLVRLVTMPENNLILDPFMGSGSTLVACQRAGVPAIGIELNEEYAEIAVKRLTR